MHLHFKWNDKTGETSITPRSLELLQYRFEEDGTGIQILDFLSDVMYLVSVEYEAALNATLNRGGNAAKAKATGDGTLLDYGICSESDFLWKTVRLDYNDCYISDEIREGDQTVIFRPASPDCQTGQ